LGIKSAKNLKIPKAVAALLWQKNERVSAPVGVGAPAGGF